VVEVPLPLPGSEAEENFPLDYWQEPVIVSFDRRAFFVEGVSKHGASAPWRQRPF
jgi:hypothetical protein